MTMTVMGAVFGTLVLALVSTEIVSRRTERVDSVSVILSRLMRHRAAQICVLMVWWWLGWHFFAD